MTKYDPYEEVRREREQAELEDDVWRRRIGNAGDWLRRRPMESWLFFVAGLVIGHFIL